MTPQANFEPQRMERRTAIKWMVTAAASSTLFQPGSILAQGTAKPVSGYGTDPDLLKAYSPGDLWPLTFDVKQRANAEILCDIILPADDHGPSASSLKVPDFIDEWISAPYPAHAADKPVILAGLRWLDEEAKRRHGKSFADLSAREREGICDDICYLPNAKPSFVQAAQFFRKFRDLAAGGYYTTPEGMKAIGYVGNVALARYDGPPPEVLKRLGLA